MLVLLGLVALGTTVLASTLSLDGSLRQLLLGPKTDQTGEGVFHPRAVAANSILSAALPQGPSLTFERKGHTATRLADGRVLIVGGENAGGGFLNSSEIFDPAAGTFSSAATMAVGRTDHAAVKLSDGRVLVTGGRNGTGTTDTTEFFDPATGTFASGPAMGVARAGHSATPFVDGRVFIAGGDENGSAEIFDPSTGAFSAVGATLLSARSMHSSALLLDGRVLIVGGRAIDGSPVLTAEVFDSADGFSPAGELTVARVMPHLRVLFDGKVQIIGGNEDESMEVYDPSFPGVGAYAHVLPATDTCTGLRAGILTSQTRAALFHNGQTDPQVDRTEHTISELIATNQALVAGGVNSAGSVLNSISILASSSASITTDKLDYMPGETATISGRGFQPGEIVRVKIHEDPHTPQERGFDATADASGNFSGEYLVQDYDLDTKFIVSARGLTSGWTAHTTFTDANNDADVAPAYVQGAGTTTFSTIYEVTVGTAARLVRNVRIELPTGYTPVSVASAAFSSGTWNAPTITGQFVQVTTTSNAVGNSLDTGGWARIDVVATTPATSANPWQFETSNNNTNINPSGGGNSSDDTVRVLVGPPNPSQASTSFVDGSGNPIVPALALGSPATLNLRITQTAGGNNDIKYTSLAIPTCFSSPTAVSVVVRNSSGVSVGTGGYSVNVLDGFIRLPSGQVPLNGSLTVTFTTTPSCAIGSFTFPASPSQNATNPAATNNQIVSVFPGGQATAAAGLADLSITKTDSPDPVSTNGTLTYTIGVSNAGPDAASAVKVVDTLPAGTTFVSATGTNWTCNHVSGTVTCNRTGGNLPVGAAPNITITVTAPSSPGSITNSATVSSPNDNTPANNTATATTNVVNQADLSVTKSDGVTSVTAGDGVTYTYTITVSNAGPGNATGVNLSDTWPSGFTRGTVTPSQGTCTGSPSFTCSLGTINNGASATVTVMYTVPASTTASPQDNTVSVSSALTDPNNANNTATDSNTVNANADLSLAKTGPASAIAGASAGFDYTLTVTNNGPSAQTGGFSVTDTLPAGLTFQTSGSSSECSAAGQLVTCTTTSGLSVSGTKVFTVHVTLASTAAAGSTLSNSGSVTSNGTNDPTAGNNTSNTVNTTVVRQTDLALTKADEWTDGSSFDFDPVIAGATGKYRLSVTNNGPSSSSGFSITDTLPSGFTFTASGSDPNCVAGGGNTVVCTRATDLANGASAHFIIAYTANASIPDSTIKQNTATVTKSDSDTELAGDIANNTDTEDTTVIARADLQVEKSDDTDPVIAGNNLTYTVKVTNLGPSDNSGFTLSDTLPAGTSFVSATSPDCVHSAGTVTCTSAGLAAGANVSWTIVVNVSAAAADGSTLSNTASIATNNTTDPVAGNNSDTETTAVIARADLQVEKSDDTDPVIAGNNLTYTVKVTNLGPSDNSGFTLSDTLPAGTSFVSATSPDCVHSAGTVTCTSAGLAAGANVSWTIVVNVSAAAADGSTLSNTASIATNNTTDPVAGNNSDTETTAVIARADLQVEKSDDTDPVIAGNNLTYTVKVTNLGPSDNSGFTLSDTLPAGTSFVSATSPDCVHSAGTVTCTSAGLAAGANVSWTIVVNVSAAAADGSTLSNTASIATNNTTDPVAGNNSDTETTAVIARADLQVEKSDDTDPVIAGNNLTYTVKVTNLGPSDNSGFTLSDTLPAGTSFVSATSPDCVHSAGTVTCTSAGLAAGANVSWTIVVNVSAAAADGSTLSNTASIATNNTTDPVAANNSDTETTAVIARADLQVEKSDDTDPVIAGNNLTYTVKVTNLGPSDNSGFTLSDTLPAGTSFVSATSPDCVHSAGTVTCTSAGLAAGANVSWTIVVNVSAAAADGSTLSNTASIATNNTTDPVAGNNSDTETTAVIARADLQVEKSDDTDPVIAGNNLTYTVKVTNLGPSDNSGFTLSDTLPAGTSFVSATSPDCVHSAGTVTCTSAGLAAGANVSWTIVVNVSAAAADGSTLSNTASIATNNTTDPVAGNNSDTETTAVIARADLQVEKSDDTDPVIAGNNLTYTVKVTNLGPSDNSGFTLSDTLPAGTSFVSATSPDCVHSAGTVTCTSAGLAAGANVSWTIVVNVSAAAADGSTLSNTASIATNNTTDPVAGNNSDTETTAVIARADLQVEKSDDTDPVIAGNNLTYTVKVTNLGPSDNSGFTLSDTLPAGTSFVSATSPDCVHSAGTVTCTSAGLAAGANVSWTIVVNVSAAAADGSTLSNTASIATNNTTDPVAGNNSDTETTAVIARADLQVEKSDDTDPVIAGNNLTYTVKVTNLGPSDNSGFTLSDTLPAGTSFVSATSPDCVHSAGTVTCTSAGLAAGANVSWTIVVNVSAAAADGSTLSNTASIATNNTTDPVAGNNSDTETTAVIARADLQVEKSDDTDPVIAGNNLTYTVKVTNLGPSDNSGFTLSDTLPAGTSFVSATSPDCVHSAGTVTCTSAGLAAGANVSWTIVVNVSAAAADGSTLSNTASIATNNTTDPVAGNNSDTETTAVIARADLQVEKSDDTDPVIAGNNLTYTVKVTNLGPSDNSGFTLSDTLPAGTSFVSATSPDCVHSAGTVTCTSAGLAAGANVSWTIVVNVSAAAADGSTLSNTASIATNNTTDPVAANNSDTETTAVIARADLQVEKSDDTDPVIAGNNLTYTVKVTNLGPSDNSGFTLSDTLPAGTSFVSATSPDCVHSAGTVTCTSAGLAAGANVSWTIVVNVSAAAVDGSTLSNTASIATNNTTDPVAGNNSDTETTAVIARADLSITKDDTPDPVIAGQSLTYNITVSNAGPSDAQAVTVNDTLPAQLTGVSVSSSQGACAAFPCNLGTIAAGGNATITVTATVAANTADGTLLSNTATVSSTTTDPNAANDSDTETTAVIARADLSITKDDTPDPVIAGQSLTYNITVSNAGPSDAQAVTVNDTLPAQLTGVSVSSSQGACAAFPCNLGTIAAGGNATITVTATVAANTADGTLLSNTATVSSTTTDPNAANDSDTETTAVIARADLSITKDDTPDPVIAGQSLTYNITVSNAGPSDAQAVTVNDTLPAQLTGVSVSSSQGACAAFPCNLGTIAAGGNATITVTATVAANTADGTLLSNTATVSSTTTDPNAANDSDTETTAVIARADLSITKTDGVTEVTAGDGVTYTYTITVNNGGPSDAQAVTVNDTWPAGFTQGTVTPSQGTCSSGPSFTCNLGTIAVGANATVTVNYTVPSSTAAGTQTNSVAATSTTTDPDTGNNSALDTNTVLTSADLSVTKTDGVTEVTVGDGVTYTYTITVNNGGPSDAQAATVNDTWPAGFTQGTVTPSQGSCSGSPSFTCNLGTIAAGANATITVNYTVPTSTAGGTQTNTVAVTSDTSDPDTGDNSAFDTNTVLTPDVRVQKAANPAGPVSAGDEIGFDVTLSNIGTGTAFGLSFTDTLPNSALSWSIMPASAGWSISGNSLIYTPTTLAAGANTTVHVKATSTSAHCGSVSNTASASANNEKAADTGNNAATALVIVNCPDLAVSKLADASPVNAGSQIGFNITVSNIGPGEAKTVTLLDTLPSNPGMVWTVDALNSDSGCTITGANSLSCNFGNVATGTSKKVHVTSPTTPANCGSVSNTATASATNERASDTANNSSTAMIVLNDVTAPVITLNSQTITLWSPNHKYNKVKVTDLVASVSDSCSTTLNLSAVYISKVTSDEPENINSGDGNTVKDMVIANDCKSVDLRAERDGSKNGRVYTITFKVTDTAGNVGTTTAKVTVPHSQGPKGVAVDDGPVYTVTNPLCP